MEEAKPIEIADDEVLSDEELDAVEKISESEGGA